jgi:hypothetical protein
MLGVLNIGDNPILGYFYLKLDNNGNIINVGKPKEIV